jgi:uncharacterized repeat protein (TIGR03943 family)
MVVFVSIVLQSLPFVLVGAFASALVQQFLSEGVVARWMPRRRLPALLVSGLFGFVAPVCDCGVIPLARRLAAKGVPLHAAVTFILAAPVVNPIVHDDRPDRRSPERAAAVPNVGGRPGRADRARLLRARLPRGRGDQRAAGAAVRSAPTRLVRAGLLLGSALLIGKLLATGEMVRYMSPGLDPLTAFTGLLLAAMALVELRAAVLVESRHGHVDGHDHRSDPAGQVLTYLLLLVPIGLGLFVSPRALGSAALGGEDVGGWLLSFAASQSGARSAASLEPERPLLDVPDLLAYLRRAGEAGVGQRVRATGLVIRSGALGRNEFALLRYTIAHCVADARPLSLLVVTAADSGWASDQWVEVEGVLGSRERHGDRLVSIEASRVVPVAEPSNPYIPAAY